MNWNETNITSDIMLRTLSNRIGLAISLTSFFWVILWIISINRGEDENFEVLVIGGIDSTWRLVPHGFPSNKHLSQFSIENQKQIIYVKPKIYTTNKQINKNKSLLYFSYLFIYVCPYLLNSYLDNQPLGNWCMCSMRNNTSHNLVLLPTENLWLQLFVL